MQLVISLGRPPQKKTTEKETEDKNKNKTREYYIVHRTHANVAQ